MIPEQIEKIKQDYTDKYVVVDAERPELARFQDVVGQVKTVNMSGRALVEFMDFHLNIGWHDIDLDYLKVVDKPEPKAKEKKPAAKKPAAKPAAKKEAAAGGEKKLSPLEMARMQDAGAKTEAKPAAKKKMSVQEMLAAARAETGGGDAPAAKKEEPKAAPAPAATEKPAKVDRSKMSVADMLAAARAQDSGDSAPDVAAEEAPPAPEPTPEPASEPPAPAEEASEGEVVKVDRSSMSVVDMIAYCREKDA